ncbi:type II secretion system protein D (GspD) [Nitrosospira multiformis]|uniref:Type II secretion system protein D (GspD) n=1 Tax=Nitrosospira multiformis TaxID=1231 RepID=A0A1H9Z4E9_9PROT|nr:type II secretion system secretin GspD [Nitrosospira multiformis]SES76355.1 type II secretion system protein D (GspD) [Nitrosospira multiformis]
MGYRGKIVRHRSLCAVFLWMAVAGWVTEAWPVNPSVTLPVEEIDAPPRALPEADSLRASKPRSSSGQDLVTLNFVNADIEGVVKAVSEITRKNFMLDPRVKGTINIVSAKPVPRSSVYEVFLSALRLHGYAVIEDYGIIRIVPESDAKLYQSPTLGPTNKRQLAGDRIQTQVFTLQYESAVQMVPILRPLIAPNNSITANPTSNTLVITDYASNLQRLAKIIDSMDQPSGTDPVSIPLQHASAIDVAQTVNRLFSESTQSQGEGAADPTQQRFTVVADARSNTLLARSGNRAALARLRQLVTVLDSPTSAAGNMHVVFLKNADAVRLAETLRAIYHNMASPVSSSSGLSQATGTAFGTSSLGTSTSGGMGASSGTSIGGSMGNSMPGSSLGAGTAPAASTVTPAPMQTGATSATPGIIQADAATNSIIITAPDAIYNNLRAVVEKLDVRRVQVYIEALIAEITADRAAEFGIQWQNLSNAAQGGTQVFGGTNFNAGTAGGGSIISTAQNPIANAASGLTIGIMNGLVTAIPGIGPVLNIHTLIRALETDTNANILSTPTLLTLNNEEARIIIGQNVPIPTGQFIPPVGGAVTSPFQTVSRQDVGLSLKIKPLISEGNTVRVQIFQEVSSVVPGTVNATNGLITNKRSIESTVLVDDGQILVLGGLMQDSVNDSVERIPVVGAIPLVGQLFSYNKRSRNKTNLMVFLRPTLIRASDAADPLSDAQYDRVLGEQKKARPGFNLVLPDMESPTLPPRQPPPVILDDNVTPDDPEISNVQGNWDTGGVMDNTP